MSTLRKLFSVLAEPPGHLGFHPYPLRTTDLLTSWQRAGRAPPEGHPHSSPSSCLNTLSSSRPALFPFFFHCKSERLVCVEEWGLTWCLTSPRNFLKPSLKQALPIPSSSVLFLILGHTDVAQWLLLLLCSRESLLARHYGIPSIEPRLAQSSQVPYPLCMVALAPFSHF